MSDEYWISFDDDQPSVRAERLDGGRARLLEIPLGDQANLYDVVRVGDGGSFEAVVEPSGYRAYLAWAVIRRPEALDAWERELSEAGIEVRWLETVIEPVRKVALALGPENSPLETWILLNRNIQRVEIVSPLLAAHADDVERAKSDLERVVAWGAPDAEVTFAVADAFESAGRYHEAVTFWERLANTLPSWGPAHERLAICYARLEVFPYAANEFDRAAHLTEEPEHRARLEAARDLMWERSRL